MTSPPEPEETFRSHMGLLARNLSNIETDVKDFDKRVRELEGAQKVDAERFKNLEKNLDSTTNSLNLRVERLQNTAAELQVSIANLDEKFTNVINDLKTEQATHVAQLKTLGAIAGGALGIIQLIQFFAQSGQ